jgi:citrate lyase beta subunit
MMRSKLFVPGSRPELFAKAMSGPADAISIDLEDAVLESRKSEARQTVGDFLREQGDDSTPDKLVIVRINDITTKHFENDLDAVAWPALHAVNLPKAESPKMVRAVAEILDRLEAERGITRRIGILANIESPKGLRRAAKIASASRRLIGLQIGFGDLFEPLSMDRRNSEAVHQVQLAVRFAAAGGNLPAYDGAFSDVSDPEGYRAEAMHARRLGYAGKSCIHPNQVAMANDVFRPSEEEIGFAQRVLAAWVDAERRGLGAITVEGRMIDKPFVERARLITAAAQAAM